MSSHKQLFTETIRRAPVQFNALDCQYLWRQRFFERVSVSFKMWSVIDLIFVATQLSGFEFTFFQRCLSTQGRLDFSEPK